MKQLYTLLICCLSFTALQAQEMFGIANSNYAGTNGISLNPSSMASSRLKLDVNILTAGASVDNNYIYEPRSQLKFFGFKRIVDNLGEGKKGIGFTDAKNFDINDLSRAYSGYYNSTLRLPSVMFGFKENYFHVMPFNIRSVFSATDIPAPIAKFIYEDQGIAYGPLSQRNLNFKEFKFDMASWAESGISYARPIVNKDDHFLSGGITIKYLWGFYSAYLNSGAANIALDTVGFTDTVFVNRANISYGYSYNEDEDGTDVFHGSGIGFDFGMTYEYRPESQRHSYDIDGETLLDPSKNQYLFKIGVSFMDLGKIKYRNSTNFNLTANNLVIAEYDTVNFEDFTDFDTTLSNYAYNDPFASNRGDKFDMALPHAMSVQVDYHAYKGLYLNMTWINALKNKSKPGPDANGTIALTPRYEWKYYEVAMPMSLYKYDQFRLGLAFRVFGLTVGSDKIGALLKLTDLSGMDAWVSLKVPITKERIRDTDGDGVSDKRDKCPFEKGTWATLGCPDRDGDEIVDKEDACPDVKGIAKFQGCPDTDNDGIQDKEDDCPQVAGLAQFKGCPDTDGDNIPDPQDSCVTVAGPSEFYGCPDTDLDRIADRLDSCPTEKGLMQYNGCPDTDGDGLINKVDSCPQVAGPASNYGCPVVEKIKREPVKVELTKEEEEVINKVFKNLEFETGKSVIRESSFSSLDELSELLKKKPNFKLLIDGHTDNVGKAAYNMKLSQNRAGAVKTYLVNKGIDTSRITSKGYGLTKPIASNKTAEGRQKNRRVEFTIVE